MLNIEGEIVDSKPVDFWPPVFTLGFRPVLLAAGVFAILAMGIWMARFYFCCAD